MAIMILELVFGVILALSLIAILFYWRNSHIKWKIYSSIVLPLLSKIKSRILSSQHLMNPKGSKETPTSSSNASAGLEGQSSDTTVISNPPSDDFANPIIEYFDLKDHLKSRDETIKNVQQALGGLIILLGVGLSFWQFRISQQQFEETLKSTRDQIELSRKGQVLENFKEAIHNIGENDPILRISGLQSLEQISRNSSEDYLDAVTSIIVSFLRERASEKNYKKINSDGDNWPPVDIKTALMIIGRLPYNGKNQPDLRGIFLGRNDEKWADYTEVKLEHVKLDKAMMNRVIMVGGSLKGSSLRESQMQNANLEVCDLSEADLYRSQLNKANFKNATLSDTKFEGATMTGATLTLAKMPRAILTGATLGKASMLATVLNDTDIEGTDLSEVDNLTQDQVSKARGNSETKLPSHLFKPPNWKR